MSHVDSWIVVDLNTVRRWNGSTFSAPKDFDDRYSVIGRLPLDCLDACEWDDSFRLPKGWETGVKWDATTLAWRLFAAKPVDVQEYQNKPDQAPWSSYLMTWCTKHIPNKFDSGLYNTLYVLKTALTTAEEWKAQKETAVKTIDKYAKECKEWQKRFHDSIISLADGPKINGAPPPVLKPKKGPSSMFKLFGYLFKNLPAVLLLTAALNGPAVWNYAVTWWTAPTALELGDWVKVQSCDECKAVSIDSAIMCRRCGGETFTIQKAQELLQPTWSPRADARPYVRGHTFPDGSVITVPGHWKLPEREVRS